MASVDTVNGTSATANQGASTATASASLAGDLQSFLKLLTTQLQNQDPLKPTDSTQFVTQLAMFAQAEQSVNTNRRLETIVELVRGQMLSDASNFLGKEVVVPSDAVAFDGTHQVPFSYTVPEDVETVAITVKDAAGRIVRTAQGKAEAGRYDDIWDGRTDSGTTAPAGNYTIGVTAGDRSTGTPTSRELQTTVRGIVEEMRVSDGKVVAVVAGQEIPIEKISGLGSVSTTATAQ